MTGVPRDLVALEAVRSVADEYGIPTGQLKPCIAYLLDGNLTAADRHKVAFTIAIELRGLGWSETQVSKALKRWAAKIDYRTADAQRALRSAFKKKPNGAWLYHPPGLHKRGRVYQETLKPICDDVGCPANCPAFSHKFAGQVGETFDRFRDLGWAAWLKKNRRRAPLDVYEAICHREKQLGLAPGVELLTSYRQLAELADVHPTTVGDALRQLAKLGLIALEVGSGSGPNARDKVPSRVKRVVPIPAPPGAPIRAITAGGEPRPDIGRESHQGNGQAHVSRSWGALTSPRSAEGKP